MHSFSIWDSFSKVSFPTSILTFLIATKSFRLLSLAKYTSPKPLGVIRYSQRDPAPSFPLNSKTSSDIEFTICLEREIE